jgi:DNA-binding NarL/FixJ family response regulator
MKKTINILLIERNIILIDHLKEQFEQDKELNYVGTFSDEKQVMAFLEKNPLDVIVMDYLQTNGLVLTDSISKKFPAIKIIGFSIEDGHYSKRLLELGATVYLSKFETTLIELITQIKICCST